EYGELHEAAALLGWFDPQTIRATGSTAERETVDQLLAHSEQTVDASGRQGWTLSPEVRVATLRQLRARDRVREALAASQMRPEDPMQRTLQAYLTATAEPVEEQSLSQLGLTYQACEWLRAAGFEGLPEQNAITRRTDWLTLLEPFEHLAGV